jgi:transposase InsO family protein
MAREEVPMSLRRAIVEADPRSLNVAEFCRCHGVSTWFFWDLRRRHASDGDAALEPKSRAPHQPAGRTPLEVEEAIVRTRKELYDGGWDCGPASIAFALRELPGVPHESTIWRILTARGLISPDPSKAPKSAGRSFTAERANEVWALDDWTWHLADGTEVQILDVLDDHSRYAVACTAMISCTGAASFDTLVGAAGWLGWPQRFWSDNARAFTGTLATALAPLGVAASHTRPYSPASNGKVERFHQTLRKWLSKQPPAATITELQAQLDLFRLHYNTRRPHRALERRFPADVWTAAPKTGPADRPLTTPTSVHHSTIHAAKAYAGRYTISVGAGHDHQPALTIITGTNAHVFIHGRLVRQLTIDTTRRSQPLHPRPGRPPTITEREAPRHA